MKLQTDWTLRLEERIESFIDKLRVPNEPGRFLPCVTGATDEGRRIQLGFSCLALKTLVVLGAWQRLDRRSQLEWIGFLKSFQVQSIPGLSWVSEGAFFDRVHMHAFSRQMSWYEKFANKFVQRRQTAREKLVLAETKQAIATLAEVGEHPDEPFRGFEMNPAKLRQYLISLDWRRPWSAGGQASALAVFLQSEAPRLMEQSTVRDLTKILSDFFEEIVHRETGTYFSGEKPSFGQSVNGAMKVLTALDWLKIPIHRPERLIDTCLKRLPDAEGCHLVDWVYVLYRASNQTPHKKGHIRSQASRVLEMIRRHHNVDGGFSSRIGRSKSHYYRVRTSVGLPESDIHGTCLLTWATSMLLHIQGRGEGWNVIKP